MNRLLRPSEAPPDVRPAMLSVWVALLLLLIPSLLFTTSEQKLVGLQIGLLGTGSATPPTGAVERVAVRLAAGGTITVEADVRRTDVGAASGDVVHRTLDLAPRDGAPDWTGLQAELGALKAVDPGVRRAILDPDPSLSTQDVVGFVDAVRARDGKELLPDIVLRAGESP